MQNLWRLEKVGIVGLGEIELMFSEFGEDYSFEWSFEEDDASWAKVGNRESKGG
jgi:hypothetical protein